MKRLLPSPPAWPWPPCSPFGVRPRDRPGGDPKSPIASVVTVPAGYDTIYVSGMTPPMLDPKGDPALTATFGDTKTQTLGVLKRIEARP
jgi:hypothetical protein